MNYKKINKFLILYIIYVIFVFARWQMTHRLVFYPDTFQPIDLSIFLYVDDNLYFIHFIVYLSLISIFFLRIEEHELIRITRKKLINKNALIVVFGSLFMSVTINLIQIINVMIETKAVGIGTIINAFIETNYIPIHFLLCIFYWVCFGCIGFLYLFVYYKTLRKWSAIVITIALVVLSYGLYFFFQIEILFLDYYDFSKLFDYRGFILPIPYLDCAWSILKYGVLMHLAYYLGKKIFMKRDVLKIVD